MHQTRVPAWLHFLSTYCMLSRVLQAFPQLIASGLGLWSRGGLEPGAERPLGGDGL